MTRNVSEKLPASAGTPLIELDAERDRNFGNLGRGRGDLKGGGYLERELSLRVRAAG